MKKRTSKILVALGMSVAGAVFMASCADGYYNVADGGLYFPPAADWKGETYLGISENDFLSAEEYPTSNVSMDTSTYAYSNLRRLIKQGGPIPKDSVVIEQMLNYFNYSFENTTDEALAVKSELGVCPWNEGHYLASVEVKAQDYECKDQKDNFVFLIDVSGSMSLDNRLPLLQQSFRLLLNELDAEDTVSIVTYASGVRTVAEGVSGADKLALEDYILSLQAHGSTNGSGGIQEAYRLAEKHFSEGGNNRIILATDGDFNVGITSTGSLERLIEQKAKSGVYLSVLGFGMGNTRQDIMETLASKGNGNSYYIDSLLEAKKVMVSELGGTLNTVAKDVKCRIEFDPDYVDSYRLLGYENKQLSDDQFDDERTDAGEIGAGHTTIVMYELVLKPGYETGEPFRTVLRYKDVETGENKEIIAPMSGVSEEVTEDFVFASCVVEFALILRDSRYKGDASYQNLIARLNSLQPFNDVYKDEFRNLVALMTDVDI